MCTETSAKNPNYGCKITNRTDQPVTVEVFTDSQSFTPLETLTIPPKETRNTSGKNLRFILGSHHYIIHSPTNDRIVLTESCTLRENANRKVTKFLCKGDEILPLVDEIKSLAKLIKDPKTDKAEKEEHARQLINTKDRLQELVGDLDKLGFWKKLGLGVSSAALAGAASPAIAIAMIQGIGFTSNGIAATSTAAGMMSSLGGGSTASGGLVATFQSIGATATFQSIGATGALSAAATTAVACTGAVAAVGLVFLGMKRYEKYNNSELDENYSSSEECNSCWDLCYAHSIRSNQSM